MALSNNTVVVVGAGLSGLAAAVELARTFSVVVVERLPAAGGVWGFDHPDVERLVRECASAGVELILGTSAIRWKDGRLLIFGPGRVEWLTAGSLVFAGGSRPATAAELGIAGGRLAGVFAATVAHHLLDANVLLGRRTAVVGTAEDAAIVLPHLSHDGTVTVIGGAAPPEAASQYAGSVRWWPGFRPVRMTGSDRVDTLTVTDGRTEFEIHCDCVILAGEPKPLRNVDGAVRDGSPDVFFIQPLDPALQASDVAAVAHRVVSELIPSQGAL